MAAATESSNNIHQLNDDAVMEILVRLPSVSVLRCGAVCRAWRAMTTSPAFVAGHARRRAPEIIAQVQRDTYSMLETIPMATLDDAKRRCLLDPSASAASAVGGDADERSKYRLMACCDGLLLLEMRRWDPLYLVCNPVSRQWIAVPAGPAPRMTLACGFYFHRPSGEHRILFLTNDDDDDHVGVGSASYYVRSLEAAETRRLAVAGPSVSNFSPSFIGYDLDDYRGRFTLWLHHPEVRYFTDNILAFDTVSETFRRMPLPPAVSGNHRDDLSLLETDDGKVALMANLHDHDGTVDLWVMDDFDTDRTSWTRRLRLQLPSTLMRVCWATNAGVPGRILLADYHSRSLGLYDLTHKRVLTQIPITAPVTHGFTDSLQRHAFFLNQSSAQ